MKKVLIIAALTLALVLTLAACGAAENAVGETAEAVRTAETATGKGKSAMPGAEKGAALQPEVPRYKSTKIVLTYRDGLDPSNNREEVVDVEQDPTRRYVLELDGETTGVVYNAGDDSVYATLVFGEDSRYTMTLADGSGTVEEGHYEISGGSFILESLQEVDDPDGHTVEVTQKVYFEMIG